MYVYYKIPDVLFVVFLLQLCTLNSVWPAVSLSMHWQLKKNTTANGSCDLQPEIQIIYKRKHMYREKANAPGRVKTRRQEGVWKMQFLAEKNAQMYCMVYIHLLSYQVLIIFTYYYYLHEFNELHQCKYVVCVCVCVCVVISPHLLYHKANSQKAFRTYNVRLVRYSLGYM